MNFSLYRGILHKVPDVPRKWAIAKPSIPLYVFRKAIAKRNEAIQRLRESQGQSGCDAPVKKESEQEPLHSLTENDCNTLHDENGAEQVRKRKRENMEVCTMEMESYDMKSDEDVSRPNSGRKPRVHSGSDLTMTSVMAVEGMECDPSFPHVTCDAAKQKQMEDANAAAEGFCCAEQGLAAVNNLTCMEITPEKESEKLEAPRTPAPEDEECAKPTERMSRELDGSVPLTVSTTVEPFLARRKAEIQETLKQLQETKHQLVQILKQVLMSEEETKRRSQILQFPAAYTSAVTLDVSLDQKTGAEMHSADLEEGELEYTRNFGPPVVTSSYGGNFSVQPSTMSATFGRQSTNSQPLNKP